MKTGLWRAVESGALLLTASARLAGWMRAEYARAQQAAGRRWPTPSIYPLPVWLERCWRDGEGGDGLLLSPFQEQWLWEDAIRRSEFSAGVEAALLDVAATARAAAAAWGLAQAWALPWDGTEWRQNEECAAFYGWALEVAGQCRRQGWITAAELPRAVAHSLGKAPGAVPAQVILAGFDELTPAQETLVEALRRCGCGVERLAPGGEPAAVGLVHPADAEQELAGAAQWARRCLESGDGTTPA